MNLIEMDEFEQIINRAVQQIPREFKSILEKEQIPVIARDKVPLAIREKFSNKIVLGVCVGLNYAQRLGSHTITHEPARIEIYKESFEQVFSQATESEIEKEVVSTVVHEIAHYFGFSETEIRKHGF